MIYNTIRYIIDQTFTDSHYATKQIKFKNNGNQSIQCY